MKNILTLALLTFVSFSTIHGATYIDANVGVSIEVPDDWKQENHANVGFVIQDPSHPKKQRKIRIHFTNATYKTPKDALEGGLNQSAKIGNTSAKDLLSSTPVVTANQVHGLRAQFGEKRDGKTFYSINKYYFKRPDGRVFCICAYVYGDASIAEKYDAMILQTLKLAPST